MPHATLFTSYQYILIMSGGGGGGGSGVVVVVVIFNEKLTGLMDVDSDHVSADKGSMIDVKVTDTGFHSLPILYIPCSFCLVLC